MELFVDKAHRAKDRGNCIRERECRRGFTLIEILVVVAIIAILSAILFPVFARARENARRASCQSNLKQIALAIHQYIQDYDELYPIYSSDSTTKLPYGWGDMIQSYVKSTQVYQCPSDSSTAGVDPIGAGYTDYAYNLSLGWTSIGARGLNSTALTQTSLTILLADEGGVPNTDDTAVHWSAGCAGSNTAAACSSGLATFRGTGAQRHLGGLNYAFADGHVKWYKSASVTQSAKVYNWWTTPANTPISIGSPTFNPFT